MAEEHTIAVAIITGVATLSGAALGVAANAIANIINRKTEMMKLTFIERGKGLFEIIKWCDSLSSSLDPANGPDFEHIQHYLQDLIKLKKYYYLLNNKIIDNIETLYIHISNIKDFNNEDYNTDESKMFFNKHLYSALGNLKTNSLEELNKYNRFDQNTLKGTLNRVKRYLKS